MKTHLTLFAGALAAGVHAMPEPRALFGKDQNAPKFTTFPQFAACPADYATANYVTPADKACRSRACCCVRVCWCVFMCVRAWLAYIF